MVFILYYLQNVVIDAKNVSNFLINANLVPELTGIFISYVYAYLDISKTKKNNVNVKIVY